MYISWTSHIKDQERKENFLREIRSSRSVLERLTDILSEREKSIDRSEASEDAYDKPNWEPRQAHKNGRREELSFLKQLINLDQQKEN